MSLIQLKNINFSVKNKTILKDISLKINDDDFITIVGPNGAGKTSLLEIITGILKATNGEVKKLANINFGYVPQKLEFNNSLPISVKYFLDLCEKNDDKFLAKIVKQTDISSLLEKQLYNLSGGEQQRVLLAKALLSKPNLLILDEPTQNLDISGQINFYKLLDQIYKTQKIAILMVSHDLHMVMKSSKKVICLYNHICCQGKPEEVSSNPEFISIFGDNMKELVSIYNHYHNHKHNH